MYEISKNDKELIFKTKIGLLLLECVGNTTKFKFLNFKRDKILTIIFFSYILKIFN
jgi:hypothetical protein